MPFSIYGFFLQQLNIYWKQLGLPAEDLSEYT
jgi:hypothetical protein